MTRPTRMIVDCPHCDGEGWVEGLIYGVDRTSGAPLSYTRRCSTCKGLGDLEVEIEPRTEEDMDAEDEQANHSS